MHTYVWFANDPLETEIDLEFLYHFPIFTIEKDCINNLEQQDEFRYVSQKI